MKFREWMNVQEDKAPTLKVKHKGKLPSLGTKKEKEKEKVRR